MANELKRVTIVADELLGYGRTGGLGTATTFLAVALGRMGLHVELLDVGPTPTVPLDPHWADLYADAGVDVRVLPRRDARTEPAFFARARDVEHALAAEPPDVVIVQDLAAPAYVALRLRQVGLGFENTLFVVYCHGTRQWITDVARKTRVLPGALAVGVLEQASIELADVIVSPSVYLLDWMRAQGWRLPSRSLVVPYLTRSAATGEPVPQRQPSAPIERIVFFGRLEERKGIRPFAAGLDAVRDLLQGVELEFFGGPTEPWPTERVAALFSDETRSALRAVSFETELDQREALTRLRRPGTLAVIPSLEDNSPNAVYECLEAGIPFIASRTGGIAELVAPEDRERVLFAPTGEGVAAALRRALTAETFPPARFAFDPAKVLDEWTRVVTTTPGAEQAAEAAASDSDFVLLHADDDVLDADAETLLRRAQAATGADIVTCAVELDPGVEHYFLGDPGALGLVSNAYGTVALVRRTLVADLEPGRDRCWPLLAGALLAGATAVSIPKPLARSRQQPGDGANDPVGALAVLQLFEQSLSHGSRLLARLAAGLTAQAATPRPIPRGRLPRLLARR